MAGRQFNERILASTRGRVLALLRRKDQTVNELADAVELTDNAVRNHLAAMERDGLIEQRGVRRQVGKPAYVYGLTAEGEALFPKVYAAVLTQVLAVLRDRDGEEGERLVLEEVARRVASLAALDETLAVRDRVEAAVSFIEELAGPVDLEWRNGQALVRGSGCPLAEVTAVDHRACHVVKALIEELAGLEAMEECQREPRPQCAFRLTPG